MPDQPRVPEQRGFSLLEIMAVLAIAMIVTAMSGMMMMNLRNQYRLRTSTVDLSTLLQRARMRAVRDNRNYQVVIDPLAQPLRVFVDLNKDGIWTQGAPGVTEDPVIQMQTGVTVQLGTSGAGNPTVPNSTLGFTPQAAGAVVGFTARGTPCYVNGGGVCSSWDLTPKPVGFVYYVQSTSGAATILAAISIAPSGRFQVWTYDRHTSTWGH
ncbi:MAG TPA: prepilin-type N-terminal cleavage/methylation domain-containing protein [Terriglobales bacterium]|nr:prepilin-type N-terminal cleavage/methylation domain-containing protein [Terriglobales bacterium]